MTPPRDPPPLETLVVEHLATIRSFIERRGRHLLDREDIEDLVQGTVASALRSASGFRYRGKAQLVAWLHTVAEAHLRERGRFWTARKRKGGRPIRITTSDSSTIDSRHAVNPPAGCPGPSTVAGKREEIDSMMEAIAGLSPRDQEILRLWKEGIGAAAMGRRLELSAEAAERARSRALARLRQALERPPGRDT